MKVSTIKMLFALQTLTLTSILVIGYFVFLNNTGIYENLNDTLYTQQRLETTFEFMDEVNAKKLAAEEARRPLPAGSIAPAFTLTDENEQEKRLADYQGKKTLLVFSREGCSFCEDFYPVITSFSEQEADVNVVVMQLNSTPAENKQYKAKYGIQVPLLATTPAELAAYKIQGTPTSVLLDEEGKVLGTEVLSSLEDLKDFVRNS